MRSRSPAGIGLYRRLDQNALQRLQGSGERRHARHDAQEIEHDVRALELPARASEQILERCLRSRRRLGAVELCRRPALRVEAIAFKRCEGLHVRVVRLDEIRSRRSHAPTREAPGSRSRKKARPSDAMPRTRVHAGGSRRRSSVRYGFVARTRHHRGVSGTLQSARGGVAERTVYCHTPLPTRGSASYKTTAVIPPMYSPSGFLKIFQDTESEASSAGSPRG